MMRSSANDKYLTTEELAERYSVSVWTVYDWNKRGTGPRYMKLRTLCRYKLADVLAWEKTRVAERGRVA
jgi:excisionase family DNA binding protein